MGDYVAIALNLFQFTYGKEQHGLVKEMLTIKINTIMIHVCKPSWHLNTLTLFLEQDTIELLQNIFESNFDESLDPLIYTEKLWYAVFLLHYW